jgi:uncharacterized DUF497 family protein
LRFEWDPVKAVRNERKHGVTFEEAETVFDHLHTLYEPDPEHSVGEERFRATGESKVRRLIVVTYTESGNVTRLISAREATRRERRRYAEAR